jgi:hypothetical protein
MWGRKTFQGSNSRGSAYGNAPETNALFRSTDVQRKLVRGPYRAHTSREQEHVVFRDSRTTHALRDLDFACTLIIAHEHARNTTAQRALRQFCRSDVQIPSIALLEIHRLVRPERL